MKEFIGKLRIVFMVLESLWVGFWVVLLGIWFVKKLLFINRIIHEAPASMEFVLLCMLFVFIPLAVIWFLWWLLPNQWKGDKQKMWS